MDIPATPLIAVQHAKTRQKGTKKMQQQQTQKEEIKTTKTSTYVTNDGWGRLVVEKLNIYIKNLNLKIQIALLM